MKKEYTLAFIAGLFILAYVLDAAVNPLTLDLATPYQYFNSENITRFPFTTASIIIKSLGLFIAPLWLLSFIQRQFSLKGVVLLIAAALMQLYALQDIVTGDQVVPIEWSLSISMAGVVLLIPTVIFIVRGTFSSMHGSLAGEATSDPFEEDDQEEEE